MPKITYYWHALLLDQLTCRKCRLLNGYEWTYDNEMPPEILTHPEFGSVWDIPQNKSLSHLNYRPASRQACRCWITYSIDTSDLGESLDELALTQKRISQGYDTIFDSLERLHKALQEVV